MTPRRTLAAAATVLILAGCGGGDEDAVRAAAQRHADALTEGDAAAVRETVSAECQEAVNGVTVSAIASEIGDGGVTINVESVDGDTAKVDIDFENIEGSSNGPATFRKVDGEWVNASCED